MAAHAVGMALFTATMGNVVPTALLELPHRNGVIQAQAPTAPVLLLGNTVLMYLLAFPR